MLAGRGRRTAAGGRAAREHQERHRRADGQRGRGRTLVRANRETEQILVERVRACGVGRENGQVTQIAEREQTFLWRRLDSPAHVPERAGSTAVADVLQLTHDPVRIAEQEIRRAVAHGDRHFHRADRVALRHAVRGERGEHAIDGEALDAEAVVVDARRRVRCRRRDGDELRSGADPQDRRCVDPRLDRHAEQTLIEVDRAFRIRDGESEVTEVRTRIGGLAARLG